MSVTGIIFSNLHDSMIPELTRVRSMASVPFCCRYRLIDFPLSNFVNSGITDVRVIASQNYQSLMDHLGAGKDWDLARRTGGLRIIPPFMHAFANQGAYAATSRLNVLKSISHIIFELKTDYVILSDCDCICNVNLSDMIAQHEKSGAEITIAVKQMNLTPDKASGAIVVSSDEDGRINDVLVNPGNTVGCYDVGINLFLINRKYLQSVLSEALARGYTSLSRDVLAAKNRKDRFMVYRYDGYYERISSLSEYFACNMRLLTDRDTKKSLFGVNKRPIYTKVRNSPPVKYCDGAKVTSSLIADGCVIEGTVENSILFRGVHVGKNSVVKNSILFQDTYVGTDVTLNCVVTDKNVVIRDARNLSGHETLPFYIEKDKMV